MTKMKSFKQNLRHMLGLDAPSSLSDKKDLKWLSFFFVLILGTIFFIPLVAFTKGYFVYYGDFNAQQISFYRLAHDAVRAGEFGWNWNTDLGVNFIGSYSFYLLGSPFFWLTIPFPSACVPYMMAPLLILKMAFMSLFTYMYLERFVKPGYAFLGGIMYAFSGFSIYNIFFNHFHEAMVYLPLVLYALERYMGDGKRGLFAITICLSALNNYYFFIGQTLFLLIYFFLRLWSGAWKTNAKQVILLFLEAMIGTMAAGIFLLPSFYSVIQNSRAGSLLAGQDAMIYNQNQRLYDIIHSYFFPSDIPARPNFFPDANNKWSSMSAWIPMFGCTGAIAYFQSSKHKDWLHRVLTVLVIMSVVPFFNAAFQLFNWQYYARWFYMLTLMLITATVLALNERTTEKVNWNRAFGWSVGFTLFFTIFIGLMPKDWKADKLSLGFEQYTDRFWIYVGIVLVGLSLAYMLLEIKKTNEKAFLTWTILALSLVSLGYSWYTVILGKQAANYEPDFVIERCIEGKDKVELPDTTQWCRTDINQCMDNVGLYWQIPCIQCFHSIVPGSIMDYYKTIGITRSVGSRPEQEDHYALRSYLSVKWLFDYDDYEGPSTHKSADKNFVDSQGNSTMPGYAYTSKTNGFRVYKNQNYIPMGFTYDSYMLRSEFDQVPGDDKEMLLLKTLVVEDAYEKYVKDYLPRQKGVPVYTYDEFEKDCKARNQYTCTTFNPTSKGFTAKIDLPYDNVVFFSVPHEPNAWSATVNGQDAKVIKAGAGFMAVACPKGTSDIEFKYHTPGFTGGLTFTFAGIFLFNVYLFLFDKKRTRKKVSKNVQVIEEKPVNADFTEQ